MTDPRFLPADLAPPYRHAPQAADGRQQKIRIERVKLAADWASGGTSFGYPVHWGMESSGATDGVVAHQVPEAALFLRDPCSLLSGTLGAGVYLTVWQPEDATDGHWEPLQVGKREYGGCFGDGTVENSEDAWTLVDFGDTSMDHSAGVVAVGGGMIALARPGTWRIRGELTFQAVDTSSDNVIEMRLGRFSGFLFGGQLGSIMEAHAHSDHSGYVGVTVNKDLIGERVGIQFRRKPGYGYGAIQAIRMSITIGEV